MRQAANYNVHATESLPQSLALHFISPSGEDMDISGMTLRGAVVQDGGEYGIGDMAEAGRRMRRI